MDINYNDVNYTCNCQGRGGRLNPDQINEILNEMFEDYISGGTLEQYIINAMAETYTQDQINAMLSDMATMTWVEAQGYLTEHQDLTPYALTTAVTESINQAIESETARTDENYISKDVVGEVVVKSYLSNETPRATTIEVRTQDTDSGEITSSMRYVRQVNDTAIITNVPGGENIYLPSLKDYAMLVDRVAFLESVVSSHLNEPPTVPARGAFYITYNVTGTSAPTQILDPRGISSFTRAALENNTTVPLATGYTFSNTGLVNLYFDVNLRTIKQYSFYNCLAVENLYVPAGVTFAGSQAFKGCTNLKTVTIGSGTTTIGDSTFIGCTSLSGVTLPSTLESVQRMAFSGCTALTAITIPDSVTRIEEWAFADAPIVNLVIPSAVERIDRGAITSASGYVRFMGTTPPTISLEESNLAGSYPIYVPDSAVDAYRTAYPSIASRIQAWS